MSLRGAANAPSNDAKCYIVLTRNVPWLLWPLTSLAIDPPKSDTWHRQSLVNTLPVLANTPSAPRQRHRAYCPARIVRRLSRSGGWCGSLGGVDVIGQQGSGEVKLACAVCAGLWSRCHGAERR